MYLFTYSDLNTKSFRPMYIILYMSSFISATYHLIISHLALSLQGHGRLQIQAENFVKSRGGHSHWKGVCAAVMSPLFQASRRSLAHQLTVNAPLLWPRFQFLGNFWIFSHVLAKILGSLRLLLCQFFCLFLFLFFCLFVFSGGAVSGLSRFSIYTVDSYRGHPCLGLAAIFAGMLYNVQIIQKSSTRNIMHVSIIVLELPAKLQWVID